MAHFREDKHQIFVDCYAIELYLPADYVDKAYRGAEYYVVLGNKVRYLGVGNIRYFSTAKEMENTEKVETYPFSVPMFLTSEPTEIDTRKVKFSPSAKERDCVVLTFYKGDRFLVNTEIIKNNKAMMMVLTRLEQGKFDHLPPEVVVQTIRDCESLNGINLRIPSEELEIFVAERYRDPTNPSRKYRYHTGAVDPDKLVTYNMRVDAMQSTTFQGVTHEDINNALISAVNRKADGIIDEPTPYECIIRGIPLDDLKKQDHPDLYSDKRE